MVPHDAAGAGVGAVLVVVPDDAVLVHDEFEAEAVPDGPVVAPVVQRLWSEELLGALGGEQPTGAHGLHEHHQIIRRDMRSAVWGPDRWVAEDVLLPAGPLAGGVEHRVPAFGDVRRRLPTVVEIRPGHVGAAEHGAADMVPVAGAGDRLDRQADQDVSDVAVSAPAARREHRRLVHELRQPIPGLDDRIARLVGPQCLVVLAGFLVGVVGDPGRVGQQVPHGHRRRDRRPRSTRRPRRSARPNPAALVDQLQRRHRGEQLGDRRGVEPGCQSDRRRPPTGGPAVGPREQRRLAAADEHDPGEQVRRGPRPQPDIQPGEGHSP